MEVALGRIAEISKSGTYYETVYWPSGGKLAVMSGQSLNFALVPLAGGAVAEYQAVVCSTTGMQTGWAAGDSAPQITYSESA